MNRTAFADYERRHVINSREHAGLRGVVIHRRFDCLFIVLVPIAPAFRPPLTRMTQLLAQGSLSDALENTADGRAVGRRPGSS